MIWEKPFLSGEDNMSHTIANLEHHHFDLTSPPPGDVHVHFFGTATLSVSTDGIKPLDGDVFEVEDEAVLLTVRNRLATDKAVHLRGEGSLRREDAWRTSVLLSSVSERLHRDQHLPSNKANRGVQACRSGQPQRSRRRRRQLSGHRFAAGARIGVDAVALCMPPGPRHAAALKALSRGKHVLLEKPPGATVCELDDLIAMANTQGVSLFATGIRDLPQVSAPGRALASRAIRSVRVDWKEDVRKWHPGQAWIWEPGGFDSVRGSTPCRSSQKSSRCRSSLTSATLLFPQTAPSRLRPTWRLADGAGGDRVSATFDWRQTGPQTWDITVITDDGGLLLLQLGGSKLTIKGEPVVEQGDVELYRFVSPLRRTRRPAPHERCRFGRPLRHVADAFMCGRHAFTDRFED